MRQSGGRTALGYRWEAAQHRHGACRATNVKKARCADRFCQRRIHPGAHRLDGILTLRLDGMPWWLSGGRDGCRISASRHGGRVINELDEFLT